MGINVRNAKLYEAMAMRDDDPSVSSAIRRSLEVVRTHLGMDVAYLSQFDGESWVVRDIDAGSLQIPLKVGQRLRRADTFCGNIADGTLPKVIQDVAKIPLAANLPAKRMLGVGAHVGTPVLVNDAPWGMLCCYSTRADPSLNDRDLSFLEAFAEMAAFEVRRETIEDAAARESYERVSSVIEEEDGMVALLQPIWDIARGARWGAEALCRIVADPARGPDSWFAEAGTVSLREQLELAAVRKGIAGDAFVDPGLVLSINVSPATVLQPGFRDALGGVSPRRLVLELTEHVQVDDYGALKTALAPLRAAGLRVAVDDAGGGYASMTHILQLQPDIIKADMSLTRDIDSDRAKQALVAALVGFAGATKAQLIAEGVETAAELAELRRLGVELGQGYLLGRPSRPQDVELAFIFGAGAFKPAGRMHEAFDTGDDYPDVLAARKKLAATTDQWLSRWVV